ncbi:MAG: ribonuclease H-like domain-containing protein [Clostridiales bacterium]|nr:ribonuclease H-like domain-containing protein [Clostridiales bacterium]
MRTLKTPLTGFWPSYPLEKLAPLDEILFLDIETTGFAAISSSLYMIGCAYYEDGGFHLIQWFAAKKEDEQELLHAFFKFASKHRLLIHFNGNTFDLPYLQKKCEQYGLSYGFDSFEGIDLYKRILPYKELLNLPDCKQRTLEDFLGLHREDPFQGGELIAVYKKYISSPTDIAFQALMQHNADDIKGMLSLLPLLTYNDLFTAPLKVKKAQANYYQDSQGERKKELILNCRLSSPLPSPVSCHHMDCYMSAEGTAVSLRIPIYEEEMKYFYSNYRDYYYLPTEDTALHKSVAAFVDKAHREKATASNCYTRKFSSYLPQWEVLFTPFFKREYASDELFFELTEDLKSNRNAFTLYTTHIMQMLLRNRTKKDHKD